MRNLIDGLMQAAYTQIAPLVALLQVLHNNYAKGNKLEYEPSAATADGTKVKLSTLWIVAMFALLAADVLSLYIPGTNDEVTQFAGETPIPLVMVIAAILMGIPIVMIFVARVLPRGVNRWANIAAAIITIVFVIGGGSTYPHYIFLATIEVVSLLLITWNAWRWPVEVKIVP